MPGFCQGQRYSSSSSRGIAGGETAAMMTSTSQIIRIAVMALEPPRIGPQDIPEEKPTEVTSEDRLRMLNLYVRVIADFHRDTMGLVPMIAFSGQEAINQVNVDGQPTMTEEQYQELKSFLDQVYGKIRELSEQMRQIPALMARILGRPLPPEWKRSDWNTPSAWRPPDGANRTIP